MTIWKGNYTIQVLNEWSENTMVEVLGIEFTEMGDNFLRARMPVDQRTKQPHGVLHGGASCVLAETVGSTAGNLCVEFTTHYCFGQSIQTNHIKTAKEGWVVGTARPIHLGKSSQVWEIDIRNEKNELVSVNRLTNMVMQRVVNQQ